MFGYVRYDYANLFVKDVALYRALYCGLCKGIGAVCGQRARLGLSYDVTFLSAILHNMTGCDVEIERQHCFEHCVRRRPMAKADELTRRLGALNTALCYYKLDDDVKDTGKGRGRRRWMKKGFKRAKRAYPEICALVERYLREQAETEEKKTSSLDAAADPTARMMEELAALLLGEKGSDAARALFYHLGKWVYLIDALDDYERDGKKGQYNPFVLAFGSGTRAELMEKHGEEISFLFDTLFYSLRESLAGVTFYFNRDLTDNVILRGIPLETARVVKGEKRTAMTVKV